MRWRTVSWSGPRAVEFPEAEMAWWTMAGVKRRESVLRGWAFLRSLRKMREDRSGMSWPMEVNCLQKALAMDLAEVRIFPPKEMGWLG